jgi:DNA-binding FrmR family transcriptional regulator
MRVESETLEAVERPSKEAALVRLRRIEGQVRGLQRMVEGGQECSAILTQLLAVRSALDAVVPSVMQAYVETCLNEPDEKVVREKLLRLVELFLRLA